MLSQLPIEPSPIITSPQVEVLHINFDYTRKRRPRKIAIGWDKEPHLDSHNRLCICSVYTSSLLAHAQFELRPDFQERAEGNSNVSTVKYSSLHLKFTTAGGIAR